jgi:CBS domain-containing protein
VAQSAGLRVESITLWMLGGVARFEHMADDPTAAIRIAAAGPAVSLACGVGGLLAGMVAGDGIVAAVLLWFGTVNLVLAAFNLLPAFPLDGGRIYQAVLRRRGMTDVAATAKASRVGVVMGKVIVWLGVIQILFAGLLGGLWLVAIGWFIREASVVEARTTARDAMLDEVAVTDVMTPDPVRVPAGHAVQAFVDDALESGRHAAYPVADHNGEIVGLAELKAVHLVPRGEWAVTPVTAVMKPIAEVVVASSADSARDLVRRMDERGDSRALVFGDEGLVGIVSPGDVARLVTTLELAHGTEAGTLPGLPPGLPRRPPPDPPSMVDLRESMPPAGVNRWVRSPAPHRGSLRRAGPRDDRPLPRPPDRG